MDKDPSVFSPNLREPLSMGECTRWAGDMTPARAIRLLDSVRIFSKRVGALREAAGFKPRPYDADGHFFFPRVLDLQHGSVPAVCGMEDMIRAFVGEAPIWAPARGPEFARTPGFAAAFAEELSRSAETRWASSLTENRLYLLLWAAGEYAYRMSTWDGYLPSFDAAREDNETIRGALRAVCIVVFPKFERDMPSAGTD